MLSWGEMAFLVFNALIGIPLLLALSCTLKLYSLMLLERQLDRAHVGSEALCAFVILP